MWDAWATPCHCIPKKQLLSAMLQDFTLHQTVTQNPLAGLLCYISDCIHPFTYYTHVTPPDQTFSFTLLESFYFVSIASPHLKPTAYYFGCLRLYVGLKTVCVKLGKFKYDWVRAQKAEFLQLYNLVKIQCMFFFTSSDREHFPTLIALIPIAIKHWC